MDKFASYFQPIAPYYDQNHSFFGQSNVFKHLHYHVSYISQ